MSGSVPSHFVEIGLGSDGSGAIDRHVPLEVPIAFEFAGLAYAVMLATPDDLEDFASGFALSEGLIDAPEDLAGLTIAEVEGGIIVRAGLPEDCADGLRDRLRLRLTEGSCGLCGLQSIEEVLRPLPRVTAAPVGSAAALKSALAQLSDRQPVSRATGSTHAAAFCDENGAIVAVREDVGRHNALDKLIGHCARSDVDMARGFVLLTARCSYELVEKTVRAGCPVLVTISAPTDLAIKRAEESGLTLVTLARSDTALVAHDPHGVFR